MKLRRIVYAVLVICLCALLISRFDAIAKSAVPYAAPKRPTITGRKNATPKPEINVGTNASPTPSNAPTNPDPANPDPGNLPDAVTALAQPATTAPSDALTPVIDVSRASEGIVSALYSGGGTDHVLRIQANGQKADYRATGDGKTGTAQLTFGTGEYTITYLINVSGSKYAVGASAKCYYELPAGTTENQGTPGAPGVQSAPISAEDARFLGVTSEINWNSQQQAIQKAASLAGDTAATKEKVKKIYTFIIQNIVYDYSVYGKLPSGYLPDIDRTYTSGKGICYDFSALFGGMLRSQGIPAKLCKGSSTFVSGYHAWNAVLIDSKWYIVDTSTDAIYVAGNVSPKMFKSSKDYAVSKEG